jgi:hypothetical protein
VTPCRLVYSYSTWGECRNQPAVWCNVLESSTVVVIHMAVSSCIYQSTRRRIFEATAVKTSNTMYAIFLVPSSGYYRYIERRSRMASTPESYSGGAWFKSRSSHRIQRPRCLFSLQINAGIVPQIRPRPLPSTSLPIHPVPQHYVVDSLITPKLI